MSKATIKAEIDANITQNGTGAITGNILNGVLNDMVDDYATQEEVTSIEGKISSIVVPSVNLFNRNSADIIKNKYYSNGFLISANGYNVTHLIKLEAGVRYKITFDNAGLSNNTAIELFDIEGTFVTEVYGTKTDNYLTIILSNSYYARFNMGRLPFDVFMCCKESEFPSSYIPYGYNLSSDIKIDASQLNQVSHDYSPNLFNVNDSRNKDGYYSAGSYVPASGYKVTHPMPVKAGITYKADYPSATLGASNNQFWKCDDDGNKIATLSGTISGNYITFSVSEDCLVSLNCGRGASTFMCCKESEFPSSYVPYYDNLILNGVTIPSESKSKLYGKSAIFAGDSICDGATDSGGQRGWASRIGAKYSMSYVNRAVSGGTIMDKDLIGSSFTICDTNWGVGADYIILEGGTNDADRIGSILGDNVPQYFGSYDLADYTSNFSNATFCSAFERMLKTIISNFPTAKVGYIVAPKMTRNSSGYDKTANNRRAYFEVAIKICKKWGVPVLDLWEESTLNPMIPSHYSGTAPDANGLYADGQHPTAKGYEVLTSKIESWMETL